ncbi:MAG: hypothetical protein R3F62_23125 [Planctomycetota bacterium]
MIEHVVEIGDTLPQDVESLAAIRDRIATTPKAAPRCSPWPCWSTPRTPSRGPRA